MLVSSIIVLLFTLVVTLLPFIYLSVSGTVHQQLQAYCLNDSTLKSHRLCISCFMPMNQQVTGSNHNVGFNNDLQYMQYSGVWIKNKILVNQSTTSAKSTAAMIGKNSNMLHKVPLRLISIGEAPQNIPNLECPDIIQMLNYQQFTIQTRSLNQLNFEVSIDSVNLLRRVYSINYITPQINSGHTFYDTKSNTIKFATIYKLPTNADPNSHTINVQYYSKVAVKIMQLIQLAIGSVGFVSCIILVSLRNLTLQQEQKYRYIPIIINLTIIVLVIVPQFIKFIASNGNATSQDLHVNEQLATSYALALYFCLCFKKLKVSRWLLLLVGVLLLVPFETWIRIVILVVCTMLFIGYSVTLIQLHPYSIYLGSCLTFLTLFNLDFEISNDVCARMARNLLIILSTVLMEVVDEIPMQKFQEYNPKVGGTKKGFMRVDQQQLEEERQFDDS